MIWFVLILLLIVFSRVQLASASDFHKDYLDKDRANVIKGIFIFLIFLSHGRKYIELGGLYDDPYLAMQNHIDQMVVSMFLFYSGYGMMEQIKKRQWDYIKTVPLKRFPKLLLDFDIVVCLFMISNWLLRKSVDIKTLLLAFTGWESIGNSNWYIFVILSLYIVFMIAFAVIYLWSHGRKMGAAEYTMGVVLLTLLSLALVYVLMKAGKERWWYDTLILFSMGFWYSLLKDQLEALVMKNDLIYSLGVAIVLIIYILFYYKRWQGIECYTIWAICFTAMAVLLTMKIKINSVFLGWLGQHIFSVFIIQHLPFRILHSIDFFSGHKYIFLIVSFAATIPMALLLEIITGKIENCIWKSSPERQSVAGTNNYMKGK